MGRLVANNDFVKALLKYGTFDEYIFANPSYSNSSLFAGVLEQWKLPLGVKERVRVISYLDLPRTLRENEFRVFHLGGWGYFAPGLHNLRRRYATNTWPITSVTHSLTGRQSIDHAVRLCEAGMATYDSVFCTSSDGREAMLQILRIASSLAAGSYKGKMDCLPLGIDDDLLGTGGDRRRARESMRIPTDAIVLLVLGRITPAQKMDLAPILSTLARQVLPNCRRPVYTVIGGGVDNSNLKLLKAIIEENRLEESTRIRANFPDESKADLLAGADIFLSPVDNHQETFGLSLLEAQAFSLPVLASRFNGYKDLVCDGVDGFLVDSYGCSADPLAEIFDLMDPELAELFEAQKIAIDMEQLARKLIELIHNDSLRAAMGEAGREKVLREYAFSKIIARYEQRWDELFLEASEAGLPEVERSPRLPDQSRIFGHFVARTLQPTDRVVAQTSARLGPSYDEVSVLLKGAELEAMLQASRNAIRVADLLATMDLPEERGWFMVMWLLKNNLLRIADIGEPP